MKNLSAPLPTAQFEHNHFTGRPTSCLLFFLLALCASTSFAQVSLKGRVTSSQQPKPSATVSLFQADSTLAKAAITDTDGVFLFTNVAPGTYRLAATMVGYAPFSSLSFSVADTNATLPTIELEELSAELSAVVVKAQKPLFEQKIDRIILNVQSTITAAGSTVLDVLQKSPGVVVNKQNNSISMNGKAGVRVMMNGKMMQLPLDVVVQMLDGMNAANVDKIELITSPPAKYDAEGNGGIINIVMKGAGDVGTNGSLALTFGYRWAENAGANFTLNHRNQKVSYFLDYSYLRNHNLHLSTMTRQSTKAGFMQTGNDYSRRENVTTQQNLDAGMEWKLSAKTLMNIGLTAYKRNWDMNAAGNNETYLAKDSTLNTRMKIHESNIWQSGTATVGLQTKLTEKTTVNFNVDYLHYANDNPSSYDNDLVYGGSQRHEVSKIDLTKKTPIHFFVATASYEQELSPSLSWEAGLKAVASHLDNNVLVQVLKNTGWVTDPYFTSYSSLSERSNAAYLSTKWQAAKTWQVNGGMRYEYTHTSIGTPVQKNLVNRKYGYFFPSLFIKKDFVEGSDIQFSYTKRITRPSYNDIAPFVFFWGPNTFSAGNTFLLPAISNAFRAGYHQNQWIVSLQYTHTKNEIVPFQTEKDSLSDNLIIRAQNLAASNIFSITNSYSLNLRPWWKLQTNLTAQYQTTQTSNLHDNTTQGTYGLNVNVSNSLKLPKDFSAEISGTFQSKMQFGISAFLPAGSLNVGLQKKFGNKGTFRLAMDDILYTNIWKIKTFSPQNDLNTFWNYDLHSQYIRLTYTRSFGNSKLPSMNVKSGSGEERKRVGN